MSYSIGIDLGTTFTAAAVADDQGVRMAGLTHDGVAIPSVLTRTSDGIAVGDAALAVAATKPWMVAREFKRRFGDDTPFIIGDDRWTALELTGMLFDWVLEHVASIEGAPPSSVAITHPATWSVHRLELLEKATSSAAVERQFVPEPVAAAVHYHERSRVDIGASIAIYDLGGGTFDATVLRRTEDGYSVVGRPSGVDQLGGLDFDQVVFDLVVETMPEVFADLDPDDIDIQRSVARLREECTRAKIGLSFDARASVPVVLPGVATDVLVARSDFESRIEPYVSRSMATLADTIQTAGLEADDLSSVLLVGGSSRVPMVAERLHATLGVEVVIDTHPKFSVAMGAVLSLPDQVPSKQRPSERAATASGVESNVLPHPTVDISHLLASVAEPRLVIVSGPSAGRTFELAEGSTTIGRSGDRADFAVPDPAASRLHLRIERSGASLVATDLGSTAGTRVDRQMITEPVALEVGSLIEMGSTWLLIDDPLRRIATPGAVLLDLIGTEDPVSVGKPGRGWATLGFGDDPLRPVRIQLVGRTTHIEIPGSLGEDLLRSMLLEMDVLEPTLPIAVLTDNPDRWSFIASDTFHSVLCRAPSEIPANVLDHGLLIIDFGPLDVADADRFDERSAPDSGIVWLGGWRGDQHQGDQDQGADQVIRLDLATAAVELASGGTGIWVDVPATLGESAIDGIEFSS